VINHEYYFRAANPNYRYLGKQMDTALPWAGLHDGYFKSSVCVDVIYKAVDDGA
jgi:hypothetical protein